MIPFATIKINYILMKLKFLFLGLWLCSCASQKITISDINSAQATWASGMYTIANTYQSGGNYSQAATNHVQNCYGFNEFTEVLFRPTTVDQQIFRNTADGAISYFIGGNTAFPDDRKVVNPLISIRFDNKFVKIEKNLAIVSGIYYFKNTENSPESVSEYTFAYAKNKKGALKIILHSSHKPFQTAK
jgi:hypothetical protein